MAAALPRSWRPSERAFRDSRPADGSPSPAIAHALHAEFEWDDHAAAVEYRWSRPRIIRCAFGSQPRLTARSRIRFARATVGPGIAMPLDDVLARSGCASNAHPGAAEAQSGTCDMSDLPS